VEGVAKVGETLTATITPSGATASYQWMRSDSEDKDGTYTNISGATEKTYKLVAADVGKYIKVKATGTGDYKGTVESEPVGPVEEEPDTTAPEFKGVTPAEGNVELAHDGNFILTVEASDENLYELEVDHNIADLPEFSVYASEEDPYGGQGSAFAEAGVTVTYNAAEQKWTIDFGEEVTERFVEAGGVTFYLVLKDEAGNQWGSMYEVTDENTFAYTVTRAEAPDTTAPTLVSVTPAEGNVELAHDGNFILTVEASDENLYELEVDHNIADLPEFSVYASEEDPYGGQGSAFAEAGVTVTYNAAEQKWTIDFGEEVTERFVEAGGVTFYLVLKDEAGNQWGSMYEVTDENTFAYTVTRAEAPDTTAPTLVSVTPAEGNVELAHDGNFILTVEASDENLYELEVDHNIADLPEFSVYASEEDPYGGQGSAFAEAGVTVTYNAAEQKWTIDFGEEVTERFVEAGGVTFYLVLKDEAGNQWGSMYEVTDENTFAYTVTRAEAPDTTAPTLVSVTPAEGNVELAHDGNFILTVEASDENLYELEVDHNIADLPEFSVYASEEDPYGGQGSAFAEAGVTVTYNAAEQKWTIDFGEEVTERFVEAGGVTFYLVLKDEAGNQWGSMYEVTDENTFAYTVTRAEAPDTTAPTLVSVTPAEGNVELAHDGNFILTVEASDENLYELEVDHNIADLPEFSVYASEEDPYGGQGSAFAEAGVTVTYNAAEQKWTIDFGEEVTERFVEAGGVTFYLVLKDEAGNQWGSMYEVTDENTFAYTVTRAEAPDTTAPTLVSVTPAEGNVELAHDGNFILTVEASDENLYELEVDHNIADLPEFSVYASEEDPYGGQGSAFAEAGVTVTYNAAEQKWTIDFGEEVTERFVEAGGVTFYLVLKDEAGNQWGSMYEVTDENTFAYTVTRAEAPDTTAPTLVSVTPAEGNVELAHDGNFILTVEASDENLYELEVDHNIADLPEFSVYASEEDPYGGQGSAFAEAGVTVTYNAAEQKWTIDFGEEVTERFVEAGGVTFYLVLKDEAGNQWGSMYEVTDENTFAYTVTRAEAPDTTAPTLVSVTPAEGNVELAHDGNFILTVEASDENLYELEVDHNIADLPEFSVYASEEDPYGGQGSAFAEAGVTVTYNAAEQKWTIDFGEEVTERFVEAGGVTFYLVLKDEAGNQWGSMYEVTDENTFAYTVTRAEAPDTTAPTLVSVTPAEGNVELAHDGNFILTVEASDENLYELEVDHNIADLPEFSVYASEEDPYGGQGSAFAEAGVTVTYNAAEQKWTIDFGEEVTERFVEAGGVTFYLVLKDEAGNQWGSMYEVTDENTFAYTVTRAEAPDTTAPTLVSVTPAEGNVELAHDGNFILTVEASDENLYELEVDHNIADLPEFSVYASEEDPYGGQGSAFAEAGVTVTYNAAEQKWTIDFGEEVTERFVEAGGVTFYLVLKDEAGNQWGSMYEVTDENTFAYTVTRAEAPDTTAPTLVSVTPAEGNVELAHDGNFILTVEASDENLYELEVDHNIADLPEFSVYASEEDPYGGQGSAFAEAGVTVTYNAAEQKWTIDFGEEVTERFVEAGGVTFYLVLKDEAGNQWGSMYEVTDENTFAYTVTRAEAPDTTAPTLVSVTPAEGNVELAHDGNFILTVEASDENLYELEVDHNIADLPEFSVYASEEDPYGGQGSAFAEAGVTVTYNAAEQKWTIDFGEEVTERFVEAGGVTFYLVLKDEAGNQWGSMYEVTDENTFAYTVTRAEAPDTTAPTLVSVTPAEGNVELAHDGNFILTVEASDENLYELEVDHNIADLPEFSVYASEEDPYGGQGSAFAEAGVTVTYNAAEQKWTIDFGEEVTERFVEAGGVTFYLVLKDEAGNQWGSMYEVTDENTFAYTVTRAEAPDTTAPTLVSVTPAEGNVELAHDGNFILTVEASDENLYELEVDHNIADLPEFSVYASEEDPYGGQGSAFAEAGVTVTYNAAEQKWTIDFGEEVTERFVEAGGVTFYLVLKDEAGNQWGSMYEVTDENTFAYTVTRAEAPDTTAPTLVSVTPAEGNVELAHDGNFILTVEASDENLYELEVDHNIADLPEFSVYASEEDPYGGQGSAFAEAGVTVTYNAAEQKWTIDFGEEVTERFVEAGGVTFYLVLKDEAGNQWGSMYEVTDENTFAYTVTRAEAPDTTAPTLVSVTPAEGNVELAHDGNFILTVEASDENLYELEVDHNIAELPEFSVYASESDPYGGQGEAFAEAGVTVTYNAAEQKWIIDFGPTVTQQIVAKGGITFYLVLVDEAGNKWGSMDPTTPENTFAYTVTQDEAPEVSGSIERDPGNTGGDLQYNIEDDTVTFSNGEIKWYPEDEDFGQSSREPCRCTDKRTCRF
jgi:type IV secretory pathway TrbF-like protein